MPTYRHWTAAQRIPLIVANGLYPTDSCLSMHGRVEPDVVWLLPPDVDPGHGVEHGLHDAKRTGWVDVDVPAIWWRHWEPQTRMDPTWRAAFIRAGGGPDMADLWYVWPARIRPSRIVAVGEV